MEDRAPSALESAAREIGAAVVADDLRSAVFLVLSLTVDVRDGAVVVRKGIVREGGERPWVLASVFDDLRCSLDVASAVDGRLVPGEESFRAVWRCFPASEARLAVV